MDWRLRFGDYKAALAANESAQACVEQLQDRLRTCTADVERTALEAGLAIAQRRARGTANRLAAATEAFTQGRSVLEAIWEAPDDI
jgi:hypothetical protein